MTQSMTIHLPAVTVPDTVIETPEGGLVVPGQHIAAKDIVIEPGIIVGCIEAARQAAENAYAPYSNFRVGAAVVMADDPAQQIRTGVNVENGSYGLTVCAERTCLNSAVSAGYRNIRYLAVSTIGTLRESLPQRMPCGACRQAIQEFSGNPGMQNETLVLIDREEADFLCDVFDMPRLLAYGFHLNSAESR